MQNSIYTIDQIIIYKTQSHPIAKHTKPIHSLSRSQRNTHAQTLMFNARQTQPPKSQSLPNNPCKEPMTMPQKGDKDKMTQSRRRRPKTKDQGAKARAKPYMQAHFVCSNPLTIPLFFCSCARTERNAKRKTQSQSKAKQQAPCSHPDKTKPTEQEWKERQTDSKPPRHRTRNTAAQPSRRHTDSHHHIKEARKAKAK